MTPRKSQTLLESSRGSACIEHMHRTHYDRNGDSESTWKQHPAGCGTACTMIVRVPISMVGLWQKGFCAVNGRLKPYPKPRLPRFPYLPRMRSNVSAMKTLRTRPSESTLKMQIARHCHQTYLSPKQMQLSPSIHELKSTVDVFVIEA